MQYMEYSKIWLNLSFVALNLTFILKVRKLSQCFMQIKQLLDYPAVKVNLPEFGKYNVIG